MKLYEPLSVNNIDQCVTDLKGNIIYTHGDPTKRLMSAEKNRDYWRDKVGIKAKSHFNNWVHICEQITLLIKKSSYIREPHKIPFEGVSPISALPLREGSLYEYKCES